MHTYVGPNGSRFHYNSDFSGNICVVSPGGDESQIPGDDLIAFVTECRMRTRLQGWIEDLEPHEVRSLWSILVSRGPVVT